MLTLYSINITERVGKSFIKLSADSAFSFLGKGSKLAESVLQYVLS